MGMRWVSWRMTNVADRCTRGRWATLGVAMALAAATCLGADAGVVRQTTGIPWTQAISRLIALYIVWIIIGPVVYAAFQTSFNVSVRQERGTWAFGIALVLTFVASQVLYL